MSGNFYIILDTIQKYSMKPPLFKPGEARFWDDPYISKSMLEAHLNPDNDAASRRPDTIEKEIQHLITSGLLKQGDRVLDLGCGPGLYASRLAEKGMRVTGVDISEGSLNYAIAQAASKGLDIEYRLFNFFDMDYSDEFDAVIQTHGELGTFPDDKRDTLLSMIYQALKSEGLLIFDVTSKAKRTTGTSQNNWYVSDGGFWRPGRHLVLEQTFDYPEDNVRVDQYTIVDDKKITVYRTWLHDYTPQSIYQLLQKAGLNIIQTWNDLTGTPYQQGGYWIAVVARKG